MLIAVIGPRFAGKASVENFLISHKGFVPLRLVSEPNSGEVEYESKSNRSSWSSSSTNHRDLSRFPLPPVKNTKHLSFLSMSPLASPSPWTESHSQDALTFASPISMLEYATLNWRENFVTIDLRTRDLVEKFVKRPFFMLICVDAPLLARYARSNRSLTQSLESFVREDDELVFGSNIHGTNNMLSLRSLQDLVDIHINNNFDNISDLHHHLETLNLLDPQHLRPSWDAYFMTLATLASQRSNCMKRRVGAVLVRDNRILATGYNGTARGLKNCNEGGCDHCNGNSPSEDLPNECVCLHAEENALLEAGRERVGSNAVLYCNTCPCLKCTVKIIQTGIKTVVYNLSYKMDDASAALFREAKVELRRFDPSQRLRISNANDQLETQTHSSSTPPYTS